MINTWWVTRPKRKLNSIPELLAEFVASAANREWAGNVALHRAYEDAIENTNLKRIGERRDGRGSGGRTTIVLLKSLGLLFAQNSNNIMRVTLAGEAILDGNRIHEVLTNQVLKYQFPSCYSLSRGVKVNIRFRIHPFWFLLKLLIDSRIGYLTQEELSNIVIIQAENESDCCFETIVREIIAFRNDRNVRINPTYTSYYEDLGMSSYAQTSHYLNDIGNTIFNWLDYTQLIVRDPGKMRLDYEKKDIVQKIVNSKIPFILNPENEEVFQRRYGLAPWQQKDTRNLLKTATITPSIVRNDKIRHAFLSESLKRPITKIDVPLIEKISSLTGYPESEVEDVLQKNYAGRMASFLSTFLTNYRDMAFSSKEKATDFELATVEIFKDVFGMKARHVGAKGKTPDVLVLSDSEGFSGIIDNKAYSQYSISNDHHNRMVYNYIGNFSRYSEGASNLSFFSYLAGGFGPRINAEIESITAETSVPGSAMKVDNMIQLIQSYEEGGYNHSTIRSLFSRGHEVSLREVIEAKIR